MNKSLLHLPIAVPSVSHPNDLSVQNYRPEQSSIFKKSHPPFFPQVVGSAYEKFTEGYQPVDSSNAKVKKLVKPLLRFDAIII